MPDITYNATGFPTTYGPELAGANSLSFVWPEVAWAAVTVGKAQLQDLALHGMYSLLEMIYRIAIIYSNLRETPDGAVCRSAVYDGLDPSEKSAISYFIGLTMAKLFVSRLLSVRWLMHLDVYRNLLAPTILGNSRPDLVGLIAEGQWVVVEAKGRTNGLVASVLADAKNQTQQVATIQGIPPVLRIALMSYFNSAGTLHIAMDDPKENRQKADLPLTPELILDSYYRPFRVREEAVTVEERIDDDVFRVTSIPEIDMWVGLSNRLPQPDDVAAPLFRDRRNPQEFVGPDGIFVRLGSSWSEENMRLEPQERTRG